MEKSIKTEVHLTDNVSEIAGVIQKNWQNIHFSAQPYLDAMFEIQDVNENYYHDSAKSIIFYFLSNATTWRGEIARNVKAKLKQLLAEQES